MVLLLVWVAGSRESAVASSIVTNWVAYNDHRPGPLIPPWTPIPTWWGTSVRATAYDMRVGPGGNLTNFYTGQQLPVTLTVTANGSPDDFGECYEPFVNTPAGDLFYGVVDVGNTNSVIGVRLSANTYVTLRFSGLDPSKRYSFRGTSLRNGGYALRWTVATLLGAQDWVDAHMNGAGPGVLTSNQFPAYLGPGQAAYNSGDNKEGAVVGWDFISPAPDGTFSVQSSNYVGAIPGGLMADSTRYGYAISAFLLAEVETTAPAITSHPVPQTTVEQNRPFSLSVAASGTPLFYQWHKVGVGPVAGATQPTYSVARAALADAGDYYAQVYNPLGSVTSTVARVTVNPDGTPPSVVAAYCYPSFDPDTQVATVDRLIIEYSEAVEPTVAGDNASYLLSDGNLPASAVLTNERTVVLTLASPLAEDTDYTVQISDVTDLVGNSIGGGTNNPAPFHTWASGPGNGLLFEVFNTGAGVTVDSLTSSPLFPDSPSLRTNIYALDSRVVYPDDSQGGYGTRIRGVFIPPLSGEWVFFLRCWDRGEVYFNPNGLDAAGKQRILAEVTGNDPRDWDKFISPAFSLRGGQGYYIETLQKADTGAGTDVIKVAARLTGTGLPTLGLPTTIVDTNALLGAAIAYPLAPRDLGGPLLLLQDLEDVSAEENHPATFSIVVSNSSGLPILYRWFLNDAEVPAATGPSYTLPGVTLADDNSRLRVQVMKVGSDLMSREARLRVVPDETPPQVLAVHGSHVLNRVTVTFSERVGPGTAEDNWNYIVAGGAFTVVSAVLDGTGSNVVLTLNAPLAIGGTYDISIQYVQDLKGNPMEPALVPLRAWIHSRGFALQSLYFDIGSGTAVGDLTGNPKYPDSPDAISFVNLLEGPVNSYDNCGIRLTGWLTAPLDGDYTFFQCSDDAGQFRLSPDDNPANVSVIAQETSWNDPRTWTGDRTDGTRGTPPSNISTNPIPLLAGQWYAFEALAKEGGGGDNLGVAWQVPGFPTPTNGSPPIPGAYLMTFADPVGASLSITQQPASVTLVAPGPVSFTVGASATYLGAPWANLTYLWQRDNGAGFQDLIGAYGRTYTFDATMADVGARFRALVFSPAASTSSAVVTLSAAGQLSIRVEPNGEVVVEWSDPAWRLQATSSLPAQSWSTVSNLGETSYRIPQPTGSQFFRLVSAGGP